MNNNPLVVYIGEFCFRVLQLRPHARCAVSIMQRALLIEVREALGERREFKITNVVDLSELEKLADPASAARESAIAWTSDLERGRCVFACVDCRDSGYSSQAGFMRPCHCSAGKAQVRR